MKLSAGMFAWFCAGVKQATIVASAPSEGMRLVRAPLILVALMALFPGDARAQVALNEDFIQELQENGLTFRETNLKDYKIAPITANEDMNYEIAVRSKKVPLEVRYAIRRFDPAPNEASVPPESMGPAMFQTVVLNVARRSANDLYVLGTTTFTADNVNHDFGADWGASALVVPEKEFAGGVDRCMVVFIYKKRAGAFMFYLYNSRNQDVALNEVKGIFTTLRFR